MSGRYGAGFTLSGTNTANTQSAALINTGTAIRLAIRIIKIGIAVAPTTAPSFYLSRVTARGTQTTTLAGQPFEPAETTAAGTVDSAWSGAPTFSTSLFMDRLGLATTAGGWIVWDFRDSPLIVPATTGAGLAIVNANASGATTGTFQGSFTWDE